MNAGALPSIVQNEKFGLKLLDCVKGGGKATLLEKWKRTARVSNTNV